MQAESAQSSVQSELLKIRKRDGSTTQKFQVSKIRTAIEKAWQETGLELHPSSLDSISADVHRRMVEQSDNGIIDVEAVQDLVETVLMETGHAEVAKAYIIYRNKHAEARNSRLRPDPNAIADYIHPAKYARYIPELKRRELFHETVARVESMHLRKFSHLFESDPGLEKDIRWAFDQVRAKRVLPSMRGMQFSGPAIEQINSRQFNCSATLIDRPRVFSEVLYLLLCGCGVGYSVQFDHVENLPALKRVDRHQVRHHSIVDTIAGWSDALDKLMQSYFKTGMYVEFSYHKIRPEGAPLKTSGGRAPGHLHLKRALDQIRIVLDGAQGRRLKPLECHTVLCLAAESVLSGGIRRSSMLALFSIDDGEMMVSKTGDWFARAPWLANANNSVSLLRSDMKKRSFKRIFDSTRAWGEPGFYFTEDLQYTCNPCSEVSFNSELLITPAVLDIMAERKLRGKSDPQVKLGEAYSGFGKCNLCEINAAKCETFEEFLDAGMAATIIGTLQAAYTDYEYLGWVSEVIAERDALLGIGMTGVMDNPSIALNYDYQRRVSEKCVEWNRVYAKRIGIKSAARVMTLKPSGTASLELGCVASGIHAHHARRYIRRVTANENEPVFRYFRSLNPHMVVRKPNGDYVIEFPVEAPDGAVVKADLDALSFLEQVRQTQLNWINPGTARSDDAPGMNNNISNTVHVRENEWDKVAEYVWENNKDFTAVSMISITGDKDYQFAPCEAITTEADEAKWNHLIKHYVPVDYSSMIEEGDETALTSEAACAGGKCEI